MTFKLFVALVALGIPMIHGYSGGGKQITSECSSMTPQHHVDAQRGAFPYTITLDKKLIKAGETVGITIKGKSASDNFKGLMVQARVADTPIGSFDVSPSSQYIQLVDCGNSRGNAVTHKKIADEGINQVKLFWTAPKNLSERVNIVATVAKNGGVFWVAQKSDTLNVK